MITLACKTLSQCTTRGSALAVFSRNALYKSTFYILTYLLTSGDEHRFSGLEPSMSTNAVLQFVVGDDSNDDRVLKSLFA